MCYIHLLMFTISTTMSLSTIIHTRISIALILPDPTPRLTCIPLGFPLRIFQHIITPQPCTSAHTCPHPLSISRTNTLTMCSASEADIMASLTATPSGPVTRAATFCFHPHVTAAQKADCDRAFLALYNGVQSWFWRDRRMNGRVIRRWS